MTGGFGTFQQQKVTKQLGAGSQIRNITQAAVQRQQAIKGAREKVALQPRMEQESSNELVDQMEARLESTERFLSKLYADDRFMMAKMVDQQIELSVRETKKETRGLIDEMDEVLKDLAQWRIDRAAPSKQAMQSKQE